MPTTTDVEVMVLGGVEIEDRVVRRITGDICSPLIVNQPTKCCRVTDHTETQRTRRSLQNDDTTSCEPIPQPLIDPSLNEILKFDFAPGVLEHSSLDHDPLARQMNLVRTPPPYSRGQDARAR